jgi:pyruvate,water dikinase
MLATSAIPSSPASEATDPATPPEPASFAAPGPGSWQQDSAHFPRPISPWALEAFQSGLARGFKENCARYGLLLSHFDLRSVRGWVYVSPVPAIDAGGGEAAASEMARRFEASRKAFEGKLWRRDLELWDGELKPDSIRRNGALRAVDTAALTDEALADHLQACLDNHEEMIYRHHKFSVTAILPVGHFVSRAAAWTGLSSGELLPLLRGSTPLSNGIAAGELEAVGRALRESRLGPESFEAHLSAGCVVERLRTTPGRVGEAVRAYLDACGTHVASGYDVLDRTTAEMPDALLAAFWAARDGAARSADGELAARTAKVREAVPAEHRAEFDELLAEARHINRLRDDRGVYNDLWAAGIARRAIQEAGRRLALRGRLDDAELLFEATPAEMAALLRGGSGPASGELAERGARRTAVPAAEVPPLLGDEPVPPPLDGLPPHAQDAERAIGVAIEEVLGSATGERRGDVLPGKAVSPGVYHGRAVVVTGPDDFNKLRRGDVLVTPGTNAAFNVVLPLLGAIVTDRGALLSHAAIVAREYGIPAVVGTREATRAIPDGARVRVDGTRGRVEVLR